MTEKNATLDYKSFFEKDEDFLNQPRTRKTIHKENFTAFLNENPIEQKIERIEKQAQEKPSEMKFSPNHTYLAAATGMSMLSQVLNTSDSKLNVGSGDFTKQGRKFKLM